MAIESRGQYETDEERPSLRSRAFSNTWTQMETMIFHAITTQWDRAPGPSPFYGRLHVVQKMLDAFDKETRVQPWL